MILSFSSNSSDARFQKVSGQVRSLLAFRAVSIAAVALSLAPPAWGAGRQLTGQHAPATTPALAPSDAEKKFVVPPGFEVRLFAAEPEVVNPVAMTWDERGRLWVLELYEYPLGSPPGTKSRDRIKILEDTDNDGRADKVNVFADGLNLATGLLLGDGGAYVGQAPHLLFLQDTNRDDLADVRTALLSGFGLDDRHELLNGFIWGPDGWLYMTHGVFTYSQVKIPEASDPGVQMNAAVARFHPPTKQFEVFADGTSNPWGVDFDRRGNAFVSACVIDHLFHMAPGGLYVRQGGTPPHPYAYELLPSIVEHQHHMAAYCGVCIYQGDQFPAEYRDRVFIGNIHQNAINHDRLSPNGSSYTAAAEKDFLTTPDGWFMPVSQQVGPDGALWVADWYDKYPCYQNAQADPEGVDRERGRIWRVVHAGGRKAPGSRPESKMNLAGLSNRDLINLLEHPNVWHRRMAQRLLRERFNGTTVASRNPGNQGIAGSEHKALSELAFKAKSLEGRLAAIWTLHSAPPTDWPAMLERLMEDVEPVVRTWAVRLEATFLRKTLSEVATYRKANEHAKAGRAEELLVTRMSLLETLAADSDPSVRLAVATTCRELVSGSLTVNTRTDSDVPIEPVLAALIQASADAKDPLLPFMIWMAAEPGFARNPEPSLEWVAANGSTAMPLSGILLKKAMRRLCDTQDYRNIDLAVDFLLKTADQQTALTVAALDGLIEGQKAKPLLPKTDTRALFDLLGKSSNAQLKQRAQQLGAVWGDARSIQATLAAIADANLPVEQRIQAISAARLMKNDAAREAILQQVGGKNPDNLLNSAIAALGELGGDNVPSVLLSQWKSYSPSTRATAAQILVSRRRWAIALLSAIESKTFVASDLPLPAMRSLVESRDEFIRQRAAQVIGRVRPANADKQKLLEQKQAMILSGGPADPKAGHELARQACFTCHKLYGEGADVGPDLTGVGRSTLEALLANVIDPNQVVGRGYENVEIETKDGRSLSGRLIENTDTRIKLVSAGPKEETIATSDIESMRVSELSVMPEGLEQMPDADFRNLMLFILKPPQEQNSSNSQSETK